MSKDDNRLHSDSNAQMVCSSPANIEINYYMCNKMEDILSDFKSNPLA